MIIFKPRLLQDNMSACKSKAKLIFTCASDLVTYRDPEIPQVVLAAKDLQVFA